MGSSVVICLCLFFKVLQKSSCSFLSYLIFTYFLHGIVFHYCVFTFRQAGRCCAVLQPQSRLFTRHNIRTVPKTLWSVITFKLMRLLQRSENADQVVAFMRSASSALQQMATF